MTTNTRGEPEKISEKTRLIVAMMDAIASLAKTPNAGLTLRAMKTRVKSIAEDLIVAADTQPETGKNHEVY